VEESSGGKSGNSRAGPERNWSEIGVKENDTDDDLILLRPIGEGCSDKPKQKERRNLYKECAKRIPPQMCFINSLRCVRTLMLADCLPIIGRRPKRQ